MTKTKRLRKQQREIERQKRIAEANELALLRTECEDAAKEIKCIQNEYASMKSIQDTVVEEQSRVRNELKVQVASVKKLTESVRKLETANVAVSSNWVYDETDETTRKLQFDSVPKKKRKGRTSSMTSNLRTKKKTKHHAAGAGAGGALSTVASRNERARARHLQNQKSGRKKEEEKKNKKWKPR